jgi:hypothetical protein
MRSLRGGLLRRRYLTSTSTRASVTITDARSIIVLRLITATFLEEGKVDS